MRNTNKYNTICAFLFLFGVLMFHGGCKSDSASGPAGPTTGSLTVTILGLPGGLNANVRVTGPSSFSQVLTGTQTLSNLAAGTYTVTVNNVVTAAALVSELYYDSTSSSTINVTAGAAAQDSVQYVVRSGSGKLWVPLLVGHSLSGYSPGQLVVSGSPTPSVAIGTGVTSPAVGFDRSGNAWITTYTSNTVVKYTPGQLASSGIPTPVVVISASNGSLSIPIVMAFDATGNLWVGNYGNSTLVKYNSSQLASSGSPAPAVIIGGSALSSIIGLAFDANGNLWAASHGTSVIIKYTPSQLASTGTPTPDVTIGGFSVNTLEGLAFDVNGNLWAARGPANAIVMFTAGQLASSGSPTPTVTINANAGSLDYPSGMAFDNSGNLWVLNIGTLRMVQFSAAQLVSSGSPVPTITIGGLGSFDRAQLAFNPPPANLPIYR